MFEINIYFDEKEAPLRIHYTSEKTRNKLLFMIENAISAGKAISFIYDNEKIILNGLLIKRVKAIGGDFYK